MEEELIRVKAELVNHKLETLRWKRQAEAFHASWLGEVAKVKELKEELSRVPLPAVKAFADYVKLLPILRHLNGLEVSEEEIMKSLDYAKTWGEKHHV